MHKCDKCIEKIKVYSYDTKKDTHHFFCGECLNNLNVCSKDNCRKVFLLTDDDLKQERLIYLFNSNNKFYLYDDVKKIALVKHGSFDNLEQLLKVKQNKKKLNADKLKKIKNEREHKLRMLFDYHKLEYKNYGDCYSYIHYGKPCLEDVLSNELKKVNEKFSRKMLLANKLSNLNIPLDESLQSCYEYINNLGSGTLNETVKNIEIEYKAKMST